MLTHPITEPRTLTSKKKTPLRLNIYSMDYLDSTIFEFCESSVFLMANAQRRVSCTEKKTSGAISSRAADGAQTSGEIIERRQAT